MKLILQILAILIGIASFLPLIRANAWWIRDFDFPRMQFLVAGTVTAILLLLIGVNSLFPDAAILLFLAIGLCLQAFRMFPYSMIARRQVLTATRETGLTVIISNVLMTNRRADLLLQRIEAENPDIVVAVETDEWWTRQLRAISEKYPFSVEVPQEDTYGIVLRSRFPLVKPSVEYLVKKSIPSIHTGVRLEDGTLVHLHAVHPKPPVPDEDTSTENRDAELLIVGRRVAKNNRPTIVLGDLNDVAWSRTTRLFQKISGLLDPRIGRGRFSTFHARHWWLRWPLDHVFLSTHFRLRRLAVLPSIGSDHFPILASLSYEPERKDQQHAPEKDQDDSREATQKITEALD